MGKCNLRTNLQSTCEVSLQSLTERAQCVYACVCVCVHMYVTCAYKSVFVCTVMFRIWSNLHSRRSRLTSLISAYSTWGLVRGGGSV